MASQSHIPPRSYLVRFPTHKESLPALSLAETLSEPGDINSAPRPTRGELSKSEKASDQGELPSQTFLMQECSCPLAWGCPLELLLEEALQESEDCLFLPGPSHTMAQDP